MSIKTELKQLRRYRDVSFWISRFRITATGEFFFEACSDGYYLKSRGIPFYSRFYQFKIL